MTRAPEQTPDNPTSRDRAALGEKPRAAAACADGSVADVAGGRAEVDGLPAAFEVALAGGDGWGLTRSDLLVAVATLVAALAVCCVLWFGYGVEGVPGVSLGVSEPETGGLIDAGWDPQAPEIELDGGSLGVSDAAVAGSGLFAVVQNAEGYELVLPLGEDARVEVTGSLGVNVIEVFGGRVRCLEADCSNQVCVDTGWVARAGQMVVCLPHKLTVQVVRDPADATPLV